MELQESLTDQFLDVSTLPITGIQSHASNLLVLKNGDILCTWFSGTEEGKDDVSIYVSRRKYGSKKWSEAQKMSNNPGRSDQNPMLFETGSNDIWLMYTTQLGGNQDTALVEYRISKDGGETWSKQAVLFPHEEGVFIRQPLVITDKDEWLLPVFHCLAKDGKPWDGSYDYSAVRISKDQGENWTEYRVPNSTGYVHMDIQKTHSGYLGLFRSRWADNIYVSFSKDGKVWSSPEKTSLPNNNASIQSTILPDGNVVVAFNDSSASDATKRRASLYSNELEEIKEEDNTKEKRAFWGAPRAPMTVALSEDDGKTWKYKRNIAEGSGFALTNDSANKKNREFSYPAIAVNKNGKIDLTFTYFRQKIAFVELSEQWIKGEQ